MLVCSRCAVLLEHCFKLSRVLIHMCYCVCLLLCLLLLCLHYYFWQAATLQWQSNEICALTWTSPSATTRWQTSCASCPTWHCSTTSVLWWRRSGRRGCRNSAFPSMTSWLLVLAIWTCGLRNSAASFMGNTDCILDHSRRTWGTFDGLWKSILWSWWFYIFRWAHSQTVYSRPAS